MLLQGSREPLAAGDGRIHAMQADVEERTGEEKNVGCMMLHACQEHALEGQNLSSAAQDHPVEYIRGVAANAGLRR